MIKYKKKQKVTMLGKLSRNVSVKRKLITVMLNNKTQIIKGYLMIKLLHVSAAFL